jgi:hypothetical protein
MKNTGLRRALGTSGCTMVAISLLVSQTARGDIIPANRLIDWTKAGVPGGIPAVTTIYTNIPAGASTATIQAALDACPSNQVVLLAPGTYTITAMLRVRKNGVVLRGAGMDRTFLSSSLHPTLDDATVEVGATTTGSFWSRTGNSGTSGYTANYSVNWTAGYARGTTNVTLSSTSGLTVGQLLGLDQASDGTNVFSSGCRGDGPSSWANRGAGDRVLQQYVRVLAINGNTVTIEPGLYSPFWSASLSPQAFWSTDVSGNVQFAGVEDMTIQCNDLSTFTLCFVNAYACWARNVKLRLPREAHLGTTFTKNCEFRHCLFTDFLPNASGVYGFEPRNSSDLRFEDNIFSNYINAVNFVATSGSVFAYNFFNNDLIGSVVGNPTWNFFPHCGHGHYDLVEGNYARAQTFDCLYGNSTYNTTFRNRFVGYENPNRGWTIRILRRAYYFTAVGNVLGTGGVGMDYEGKTGNDIWCWGDVNWNDTRNTDPRVTNTLFRAGNWDVVNNAIVWGTNAVQSISNSYAYASKPSWFGDRPWPAFDPLSAAAAAATNIPAGYRFYFGIDPPSGGVGPPAPPTNVVAQ